MTDVPTDLRGASVLVTGGAGFIGGHLAEALADECDLTVLDDLTVGTPERVPDEATLVQGDTRDTRTVESIVSDTDVIFHQAGLSSVQESIRKVGEAHGRNTTGTVTVLEAARRWDARAVVASSAAIYGQPDSLPIHETDPKTPTSPYGISKLAADHYACAFGDLYDLPTVALRYFNVYGPGWSPRTAGVLKNFLDRARDDRDLVVHGDGSQTRDFVHVDDVVQANLRAAVTDDTGLAYNVGTGTETSVREAAEMIIELTGADSTINTAHPRPGDIERSRADIGRPRANLDYEPTVPLEDGLASLARRSQPAE